MTESMVKVTIQEDPLPLVIDSATPRITITDIENNVTIIEENPGCIVTGKQIGRASCRERVSSPV